MCALVSVCVARELLVLCGDPTWVSVQTACDRHVEKKRQRSVQTVRLWQRLNAHPGSKTNAFFWMVATCLLLVSSRQNLGGRDYLYHAESKCPSPSWVFRKEDSPLLMPCVFTEEVGHSTMEPAAVGTLPLHNTLSVMCSNYSQAPRKLLFYSVNAHGHDI